MSTWSLVSTRAMGLNMSPVIAQTWVIFQGGVRLIQNKNRSFQIPSCSDKDHILPGGGRDVRALGWCTEPEPCWPYFLSTAAVLPHLSPILSSPLVSAPSANLFSISLLPIQSSKWRCKLLCIIQNTFCPNSFTFKVFTTMRSGSRFLFSENRKY